MTDATLLRSGTRPILRCERRIAKPVEVVWHAFTWGTDTITSELTPTAEGETTFVLTEELGANAAARNAAGWEACLDGLELGAERQPWKHRFDHHVASRLSAVETTVELGLAGVEPAFAERHGAVAPEPT
jgi:hypothetical protein